MSVFLYDIVYILILKWIEIMTLVRQSIFPESNELIHWINISLDNGLTPKSKQAIIWTNGDLFYWRM